MPTPVIIGVGQLRNRGTEPADALEPADLIAGAAELALADATATDALRAAIDALDVVNVVSWPYADLPGLLAARLGLAPGRREHSDVGGNQPTRLVDAAARRIAAGESRAALVCGGEAYASLATFLKAKQPPPWTPAAVVKMPDARDFVSDLVYRHGLLMPIQIYPLYENGLRAALGQSLAEGQQESARIYADFSQVAAQNPAAWNPTPLTPEEIATVTPRNRMICHPYPLLMNALLNVNQAAAVIIADAELARTLGVPEERWVYPWGGAGSKDSSDVLARSSYSRSPAMEATLDAALAAAGVSVSDLDLLDFYSCFPVVPKLAARHLRLAADRRLTVTGGLTSFGGPGNNYSLHAVVAMAEALRRGDGALGLVYGQGEFVTKHHAIVLGARPPTHSYPRANPLPAEIVAPPPPIVEQPTGSATVETYTVAYNRAGEPERGFIIGRLADGSRCIANTPEGDADTFALLTGGAVEPIGLAGSVGPGPDGRNIFRFA
jgi:acetyl-CoA acetyltransferase